MDNHFSGLLIRQCVFQHPDTQLQNEYDVQYLISRDPKISSMFMTCLNDIKMKAAKKTTKSIQKSEHFREIGNRLFRANKKENAAEASCSYTNAIITAPEGSKALALAYANRSISIMELGYYKEAYDDCLCAIECGYPEEHIEKIITRQAFCANKLLDHNKLKDCVEKLKTMTLSEQFEKQKADFEANLKQLNVGQTLSFPLSKDRCIRQKILHNSEKGRYLVTSKDVKKDEVVLVEEAFAPVPIQNLKICSNCCAQHIIPFPCDVCAKVFYCSLKCRTVQHPVHKYECKAFIWDLLPNFGIMYPAIHTFLNGFPSIVKSLKTCVSGREIWQRIEEISRTGGESYAEVLSLATNFKSTHVTKPEELYSFCASSTAFSLYLKEFTSFFDMFKDSNYRKHEWTVVISAILLKHVLQVKYNGFTSTILYPIIEDDEFQCLSDYWARAGHLKRGILHTYSCLRPVYAGMFPHLSVCNHSCDPTFRLKFDGNCVVAYALRHLKTGSEIYNSYMPCFKRLPKKVRKAELKELYQFDCNCKYCLDNYHDEEYYQFYRYRCQNAYCKAVFVPQIENQDWWLQEDRLPFLMCPVCKVNLNLDWYWHFDDLTLNPIDLTSIPELLKFSEKIVEGHSELRAHICQTAARVLLASRKEAELSNSQFTAIGDAVNYLLDVVEQKYDVKNVIYAARATFALDLMALGKYFNFDKKKIRQSMDMVTTEMRSVFDNYIEDYIGEKFYIP